MEEAWLKVQDREIAALKGGELCAKLLFFIFRGGVKKAWLINKKKVKSTYSVSKFVDIKQPKPKKLTNESYTTLIETLENGRYHITL